MVVAFCVAELFILWHRGVVTITLLSKVGLSKKKSIQKSKIWSENPNSEEKVKILSTNNFLLEVCSVCQKIATLCLPSFLIVTSLILF